MDISLWSTDLRLMKSNVKEVGSSNTTSSNTNSSEPQQSLNETRTTKPAKGKALNCPRCNSKNTKFCYYNNYSLTQPDTAARHAEGTGLKVGLSEMFLLVEVPERTRNPTTVSPASTSISLSNLVSSCNTTTSTSKISDNVTNHDLNLAFSLVQPSDFTSTSSIATPFMPIMMSSVPSMSFAMQDFRSNALSCPLDFISGTDHGENSEGRLLFPIEEVGRMNYTSGDVNGHDDHYQQQQIKLPEQNEEIIIIFWNDLLSGGVD